LLLYTGSGSTSLLVTGPLRGMDIPLSSVMSHVTKT
jgi:hypothetical protein